MPALVVLTIPQFTWARSSWFSLAGVCGLTVPLGLEWIYGGGMNAVRLGQCRLVEPESSEQAMWLARFEELRRCLAESGGVPSLGFVTANGFRLGQWANWQRAQFRRGKLDTDNVARLESLDGWSWEPRDLRWENAFNALKGYLATHGRMPFLHESDDGGLRVGLWVRYQRARFGEGKLSAERVARLEGLDGWSWKLPLDTLWESGFGALQAYLAEHGCVPRSTFVTADGFHLGGWASWQISQFHEGRLAAERIERLVELPGWSWVDLSADDAAWEVGFAALQAYLAVNHCAPSRTLITEDGYRLGGWVCSQRHAYRKGSLSADRAVRLSELEVWSWEPFDDAWEAGFVALREYLVEHRRMPSQTYVAVDGYRLGRWINWQRNRYRDGKLSTERIERLEQLDLWVWSPRGRRSAAA